jgi:hypothetical protein
VKLITARAPSHKSPTLWSDEGGITFAVLVSGYPVFLGIVALTKLDTPPDTSNRSGEPLEAPVTPMPDIASRRHSAI